jgi:prevent-host-death family protein
MPSSIRFRNARGELVESARISSTDAKNGFGRIFEHVAKDGGVTIALRNEPKLVVISVEDYQRLAQADSRSLNTLTDEFDALLDRMQEPGQRAAMERAFSMTPAELGQVARKQGVVMVKRQVPRASASRDSKSKTLASGMPVSKLAGRFVTKKSHDADPLLKRSAANKGKKRSAGG